jgi:hypothetical protein
VSQNGKSSFGWFKILVLFILTPLVLTVVGGLLVEWLKPTFLGTAPTSVTPNGGTSTASAPAFQDPAQFRKANTLKLLVGKWNVIETATIYGDKEVEFTPNGQLIRTTNLIAYGNITSSYPYTIDDDGEIRTDSSLGLRLITVSADELKLAWGGLGGETIVGYRHPWPQWMIWLAGAGLIGLCILGAIMKGAMKKK